MSPDLEEERQNAGPSRPHSFGRLLREAREARGLTVEALAETTRIHLRYLTALEEEDWGTLPEGVIGRGFVRMVAREIGVPAEELQRRYQAARGGKDAEPSHTLPEADWRVDLRGGRREGSKAVFLSLGAVAAVALGLGLWNSLVPAPAPAPTPAPMTAPAPPAPAPQPEPTLPVMPAPEPTLPVMPAPEPTLPVVPGQLSAPPEPAPTPPLPEVPPAVAQAPAQPATVRLEIQAVERVWVRVTADGGAPQDRVLKPGEQVSFEAEGGFGVKLGNAGSVRLTWNGQPLRVPGKAGQVLTLSFPEAAETLRP